MKKSLDSVTLLGIDCVNIDRLVLAATICQEQLDFAEVKLLTSCPNNYKNTTSIPPITSTEEYSRFVIAELDQYVSTPHALLIQYDGFVLNPQAWSDEFLKYDYIGAPWLVQDWSVREFGFPKNSLGKLMVGNGGFSLRSKRLTAACAELAYNARFPQYHPEDVVLCVHQKEMLEEKGLSFAPPVVAKRFSFETKNDEGNEWNGQFGFHSLKYTNISRWLKTHPQYQFDMSAFK